MSGSSSQPSRAPFARYSAILSCRSSRRSDGERSSSTKSGQSGRNCRCCSGGTCSKRARRTQAASGARIAPFGSRKPVDELEATPLLSRLAHARNCMMISASRPPVFPSSRGHDAPLSLGGALDLQVAVKLTEGKELVLADLERWADAEDDLPRGCAGGAFDLRTTVLMTCSLIHGRPLAVCRRQLIIA